MQVVHHGKGHQGMVNLAKKGCHHVAAEKGNQSSVAYTTAVGWNLEFSIFAPGTSFNFDKRESCVERDGIIDTFTQ